MKNVTITLDEGTARWARQVASERGVSVSRFVGELLRQQMQQQHNYELAMKRYFSLRPRALRDAGEQYTSREALHDRARLR
jgi:hypothetical protein